MHNFLKSIGYGKITSEKRWNHFLRETEKIYTHHELVALDREVDFCEYRRECGPGIGISVCGDMDEAEHFERQYYNPYFTGSGISSCAEITIERRMDREAYVGICEDSRIGITLIFHLQNTAEYLIEKQAGKNRFASESITLAGLCNEGTILLPVMKNKEQKEQIKKESRDRKILLSAARNGDQAAMETLTLDDMDTYSKVSRRLITEDIFSIVDTYFMPYGVECDRYSILGEILDIRIIENEDTKESLYIMKLDVNEIPFDICVPKNSVVGEPEVGRRFKGDIWLQGRINF